MGMQTNEELAAARRANGERFAARSRKGKIAFGEAVKACAAAAEEALRLCEVHVDGSQPTWKQKALLRAAFVGARHMAYHVNRIGTDWATPDQVACLKQLGQLLDFAPYSIGSEFAADNAKQILELVKPHTERYGK
jgi:hypothetical protein